MKRCPKCNRPFPDDNQKFCTIDGGLLVADQPFDPNATMQGSTVQLTPTPPPQASPEQKPSAPLPDFSATIATSSSAPTVVLPKNTGPTGSATSANLHQQNQPAGQRASAPLPPPTQELRQPPAPSAPLPQAPPAPRASQAAQPTGVAAVPQKKSKLPLVLGILALLLVLGAGAVVAAFFLVIKPRLQQVEPERSVVATKTQPAEPVNTNVNAPAPSESKPAEAEFVPPPNTAKFVNAAANLDGKLAEHFIEFSFYYPNGWQPDPKAGTASSGNFAKVERRLPPDFTQENFAVRWYPSKGTYEADLPDLPKQAEDFSNSLAKFFPEYRKVSEGPTKINSLDAYEFRWTGVSRGTEKGDLQLWGRVVFVPTGVAGDSNGAILSMFTTSLAPELTSVDDVGVKGQMPVILESFRFGKKP
ncbi:MAG TPA: hypothetical protein VIW64_11620 [Pyrinomonadaceae bacterium]|jgi:hypothetical protein